MILFDGVPVVWQALLLVVLAVILAMAVWSVTLSVRGMRRCAVRPSAAGRGRRLHLGVPRAGAERGDHDPRQRGAAAGADVKRRIILVIDDGSDDRTPEILASIDHPDVHVLRREPPNARKGKAEALNDAYRTLGGMLGDADRRDVVVVVVDADGRVDREAPRYAASHFRDARVGGVQSLVRIYNRNHLLTRLQHLEFAIYARVYQAGRNGSGTAGMGGNGQYNRLAALDAIAEGSGPWRNRLTEDQDLGLRLIAAGWHSRQEVRAAVDQQGVPHLRPLFRQRTRWAQGNLQALRLLGAVWRAPLTRRVRVEEVAYLLMPVWQAVVGVGFAVAVYLAASGQASLVPTPVAVLVAYLLAFSNTVLACLASRGGTGWRAWLVALGLAHLYALYTWLLWPVLVRAAARVIGTQREWAKTEREPLAPPSAASGA